MLEKRGPGGVVNYILFNAFYAATITVIWCRILTTAVPPSRRFDLSSVSVYAVGPLPLSVLQPPTALVSPN